MFSFSFFKFIPYRGHISQAFNNLCNFFDHVIDLLRGVFLGKRKTERSVCNLVGTSYRKKHVTGVKRARCAG